MFKKWTPNIMIWDLELMSEVDGEVCSEHLYFLSRRRADRWLIKNLDKIMEEYVAYCIGGRQLWLW